MNRLILFLAAAFVLSGTIYAQTDAPKQISGGVLNGKATSLPKPAYPAAANAVNAEGAVSVQVLIDEQGNVISASAVSGHPLLRPAAVEAAEQATFSPTRLSGNPVKVSGVIVYNFVGTLTPGMFGYELAYAERAGKFAENTFAKSLAARLPAAMSLEKETLESLTYETPEPAPAAAPAGEAKPRDPNQFTVKGDTNYSASNTPPDYKGPVNTAVRGGGMGSTIVRPDGSVRIAMPGSANAYASQKLTSESVEKIRSLQAEVDSRLSSDPRVQWNFRLGRALGAFVAEIDDDQKLLANAAELERIAAGAPPALPGTIADRIRQLAERARSGQITDEVRDEMVKSAKELRNIRLASW